MYKTTYELAVYTIGEEEPLSFNDATVPGSATAALNQVVAGKDIDVMAIESLGEIIPYHAIDYVAVFPTRSEVEDPVDDTLKNCTEDSGDDGGDDGEEETT